MRFVIVTGMSGAGKTSVLKFLEDMDFFCIDNIPPALIPKFAELCYEQESKFAKIAMGVDIRACKRFDELFLILSQLEEAGYEYEIVFMDASDEILVKRYKETRRSHPLSKEGTIQDGIDLEREILKEVKQRATYILDTSNVLTRELKEQIGKIFVKGENFQSLVISVGSFGFKYGIPTDSDLVFDVRFLPNPYYLTELRELTGDSAVVSDYVLSFDVTKQFLEKLIDLVNFLIPLYIKEGKNNLVINIGCTGGKHRSVTLANALYMALNGHGSAILLKHRDIEKDAKNKR